MKTDDTYRKAATLAGVLYIFGTVTGVLIVVLTGPFLDGPEYLTKISANQTQFKK